MSYYHEDLERDLLEYEGMTGNLGGAWEPIEELRWQEDNPPPIPLPEYRPKNFVCERCGYENEDAGCSVCGGTAARRTLL